MQRRRVVVRGLVQGVFFRASCADQARSHGVTGWVSNCPDGTVEAVFEGSDAGVDAMVEWSRSGPPHAEVAEVKVIEESAQGEALFTVR